MFNIKNRYTNTRSGGCRAGFLLAEADLCLEQYSFMNIVENRTNTSKLASCFLVFITKHGENISKNFLNSAKFFVHDGRLFGKLLI